MKLFLKGVMVCSFDVNQPLPKMWKFNYAQNPSRKIYFAMDLIDKICSSKQYVNISIQPLIDLLMKDQDNNLPKLINP